MLNGIWASGKASEALNTPIDGQAERLSGQMYPFPAEAQRKNAFHSFKPWTVLLIYQDSKTFQTVNGGWKMASCGEMCMGDIMNVRPAAWNSR